MSGDETLEEAVKLQNPSSVVSDHEPHLQVCALLLTVLINNKMIVFDCIHSLRRHSYLNQPLQHPGYIMYKSILWLKFLMSLCSLFGIDDT